MMEKEMIQLLLEADAKRLCQLGRAIGSLAKDRSDIVWHIFDAIRDGMEASLSRYPYGFGDIMQGLYREWYRNHPDEVPPIPFESLIKESGTGKL